MPRVKIDYVVSFSSEDPDNQASNLLEWEVSKKKWLCSKGEPSCSVVLQLAKAVKIESISIGAYHAASVEVLVGLSEKPNESFEVLVPTSMLLSPAEARRAEGAGRVRSFGGAALAAARARRWDRVRVACAQPYNRHCRYGLSFVHVYEAEALSLRAPAEDEFRPGELFRQHALQLRAPAARADAQIRQASMDAIKNNSDTATKLLKTPITKANTATCNPDTEKCSNRRKENLMYTTDDDQPHAKIDRVVQRHQEQKEKQTSTRNVKLDDNEKEKVKATYAEDEKKAEPKRHSDRTTQRRNDSGEASTSGSSGQGRRRSEESGRAALAGVEFALSGYQNPERAALRAAALRLGARYRPDWAASCTHLVCAFPNTPKLSRARAAGWRGAAVRGAWLRACERRGRRLPWRWFAAQPQEQEEPPPGWELGDDADADTDDEIEKVLKQQQSKKRIKSPSPADDPNDCTTTKRAKTSDREAAPASGASGASGEGADDADASRESDVCFVRDERLRARVSLSDGSDTEAERGARSEEDDGAARELPNFFEGLTFTIAEDLPAEYDRGQLARYIRAYGGLVVARSELLDGSPGVARYVVGEGEGEREGERRVRPEWVWRCHARRALVAD